MHVQQHYAQQDIARVLASEQYRTNAAHHG